MKQPDASARVMTQLRGLADDIGRSFLTDEHGFDSAAASRILRARRGDGLDIRPTLGTAEVLLQRARRDEDADGRRARVEDLLSALVGEPARLCAPGGVPRPAAAREPSAHFLDVVRELGELGADGARTFADGVVTPDEAEAGIRRCLDAREAIDAYAEALRLAVQER